VDGGVTHDVADAQTQTQAARPERDEREGRAAILTTHALTKRFGGLTAVDGLDMRVCSGDVFGFLGPNGAGKTTVIRLVLGLIHPTSGHAEVAGHRVPGELRGALRHVGGFVDDPTFYPLMSARRNLRLLGSMTGPVSEERVTEVLEMVGLAERADSRVGGFSHGMRQRLGIAQALLHAPELIVLDEPTSGLDPRGMKDVRELIRDLGRSGVTVFLSSHLLHEVEQVCTRAVIIDRGRVVVQGPVSELRPQGLAVKLMTDDQARAAETARAAFGVRAVHEDDGYLIVQAGDDVPELVRRLVADDVAVRSVVPADEQGLEDFFLQLTSEAEGRGAGEAEGWGAGEAEGRAAGEPAPPAPRRGLGRRLRGRVR
jgi:ABC-2 type transport system ATP-binding protein